MGCVGTTPPPPPGQYTHPRGGGGGVKRKWENKGNEETGKMKGEKMFDKFRKNKGKTVMENMYLNIGVARIFGRVGGGGMTEYMHPD
jgi:hypothetical protein